MISCVLTYRYFVLSFSEFFRIKESSQWASLSSIIRGDDTASWHPKKDEHPDSIWSANRPDRSELANIIQNHYDREKAKQAKQAAEKRQKSVVQTQTNATATTARPKRKSGGFFKRFFGL